MAFDFWSHFRDDTLLRDQLAERIAENDALREENAGLRARLETLEWALELCRTAAHAGLKKCGGGSVDETEDGDEVPRT